MHLSIIIPMFNVEQYIEKCVESVYNLGMADSEFEVIIINDESPDKSLEIATKFTIEKKNATIISQENKGLGGARNKGIERAKGEYLLFLDSDDFLLPERLKLAVSVAKNNNLDVLEFGAQGVDEFGKILYTRATSSRDRIINGIDYCREIRYMDSACNKLYKRDFLDQNKLEFKERIFIEDYEFNTRVFARAQRVMAIPTIVSNFFQNSNSITRSTNPEKTEKMKRDIIQVIRIIDTERIQAQRENVDFYNQRLSYLTATLFYQLLKANASFRSFLDLKNQLMKEQILFLDYPIYDRKKNYFRVIFLKNFIFLRLIAGKRKVWF
jgi:glycosyltransferase involved in cell wall biosynthesis